MKIYFLGGGNMASAIATGLVKQTGYDVHIVDVNQEKRALLENELGINTHEQMPELTQDDVLVLAVKPQDMKTACAGIKQNNTLILSVAAGLDVKTLSGYLSGNQRIVRIMPNTPAKVGLGISGLFADKNVSNEDREVADDIMASVGKTIWLDSEDKMHRITGISGSGPAYVFYLLNALETAAKEQGFNDQEAYELALATFKGSIALAENTGEPFETLQKNVTSKGGTTHEAITTFQQKDVAAAIAEGVAACVRRSEELSRQF